MRLKEVRIKNFRSISEQTITLEPQCRILLGVNEAGKSNILRALALMGDEEPNPDDLRESRPSEPPINEAYIWFIFTLNEAERSRNLENAKQSSLGSDRPLLTLNDKPITIDELFTHNTIATTTQALFCVDIVNRTKSGSRWALPKGARVAPGWYKTTNACPQDFVATTPDGTPTPRPLSSFKLINASAIQEPPPQYIEKATASDVAAFLSSETPEMAARLRPDVLYWSYAEDKLLPASINLQAFLSNPDSCLPLKNMFSLAGHQDPNAAYTMASERTNGVRNLLNRVAELSTTHIKGAWKEASGISLHLQLNGSYIEATIEDVHNHFSLSRRSDGFKRFVTFLLLVSAKSKTSELSNTLILQDEPDIGLHPSGARYLRKELISLSASNWVVFSTHSIFMIDRENIERHLLVRKEEETTTTSNATGSNIADEEILFNALGYSVFETLNKKNVIFEGWRDRRMFEIARHSTRLEEQDRELLKSVGACFTKGVKDIGRVASLLELANRECIILSDSDATAIEHQRDYRGHGRWIRLDELSSGVCVTSEDFITDAALQSAVNELKSVDPRTPPMSAATLRSSSGVIASVTAALKEHNFSNAEAKEALNTFKSIVVGRLVESEITDNYMRMLGRLCVELRKPLTPFTP